MNLKTVLIIASVALLLALLPMPYGYYQLLRLVICGVSIWAAVASYKSNQNLTIWYTLVALLYNPIFIIHFDRGVWSIINVLTIIFFVYAGKILKK